MFSLFASLNVETLLSTAFIILAGALLTQFPGLWNRSVAGRPNPLRVPASPRLRVLGFPRLRVLLRRWTLALAMDQQGGYVHDTAMSQFIAPGACHYVTGTWTDAAGSVANTICKSKAAADNTAVVTVPVTLPQNSIAQKGSYLKSIDIWWEVLTAAMDGVTPVIYKAALPANGADFAAPSSQAFTYDSNHDSAAKRLTLDEHKMTLSITTPFWMDEDDLVTIEITFDAAATSALTFFGARANFTLRM